MSTTPGPGLPGPHDYRPLVPSGQGAWSDPVAPEDRPRLAAQVRRAAQRRRWVPIAIPVVMVLMIGVFFFAATSGSRGARLLPAMPVLMFVMIIAVVVLSVIRRR